MMEQEQQSEWTMAVGTLPELSLHSGSKQQLGTRILALR